MIFPEHIKLFTMKEMCHACGVSRATLLRLEESGFLKPAVTDPETGYRRYSMENVTAVGQYQRLQAIGLSRTEIADLYYERTDSAEFIKAQRQRLNMLQNFLNEYELRHDHSRDHTFSYETLPAVTCYCARIEAGSTAEAAMQAYMIHERCVSEGYRMLGSRPLFSIYDDYSTILLPEKAFHCTICIPVLPDPDVDMDPDLTAFPETEAFTLLSFGDYKNITDIWKQMIREVEARELEPSGPPRIISLIAPYAGSHYKITDFCLQCVVPVKERKG